MKCLREVMVVLLLAAGLAWADQASLDELVKKEQGNVDHEGVKVYGGAVGKLEAVFFLEFTGTGNRVDGWYYYPSRGRAKRYKLSGSNPRDGVLLLREYTPGKGGTHALTANCRLEKTLTEGRISWEGRMNNTDGRTFRMVFSRKRSGAKSPGKSGGGVLSGVSTE